MSAKIVDIANAVVSKLNLDFTGQFTATRQYRPVAKLEDLTNIAVTVVPKEMESIPISRQLDQVDHTIEIGVQQRTSGTTIDIDSKTDLVETIANGFRRSIFTVSGEKYHVTSVQVAPLVAIEHLDELNVFSSVIALTVREARIA